MSDDAEQLPVGTRNDDDTVTITWPNGKPHSFPMHAELFEQLVEQCNVATLKLAAQPRNRHERRHGRR